MSVVESSIAAGCRVHYAFPLQKPQLILGSGEGRRVFEHILHLPTLVSMWFFQNQQMLRRYQNWPLTTRIRIKRQGKAMCFITCNTAPVINNYSNKNELDKIAYVVSSNNQNLQKYSFSVLNLNTRNCNTKRALKHRI